MKLPELRGKGVLNNYDVKDSFYVDALDVLAEKSIIVSGGNLRDDT